MPAPADLTAHLTDIELLDGILGTLSWDESTYLPREAASLRGAQSALLSKLAHSARTDARIGGWLERLDTKDPVQAATQRNLGRAYRREQRIPAALVEELANEKSRAFQVWLDAKAKSDFRAMEPSLEKLVGLLRKRAESIDPSRHPYEVLLDEYDPGTTVEGLRSMFARLRDGLVPLLDAVAAKPQLAPLDDRFPLEAQWELSRRVATALGFRFEGGRLDRSEHPFSSGHGPGDVRITAHLKQDNLLGGLSGTVHEVGHGLYEQGLPASLVGTTVREAASYGLHESQSRFWENTIGRSRPFARFLSRLGSETLGVTLDPERIFRASNRVERSLIRIQADEVTYNLHIIVRFELELALFEGSLAVRDLPRAWNEKMQRTLGVVPPDDARGCLQDVHWSAGLFGYFPSYTLGNLYAASLARSIEAAHPRFWQAIEAGDFSDPLRWLRANIHEVGHLYEAPEIVRRAVGERDHVEDLVGYLWERVGGLYGVTRPA